MPEEVAVSKSFIILHVLKVRGQREEPIQDFLPWEGM